MELDKLLYLLEKHTEVILRIPGLGETVVCSTKELYDLLINLKGDQDGSR